jgi:hypothetical protein
MAILVNSVASGNGMPSAPQRIHVLNATLDASYPAGGYDISSSLAGGSVVWAETRAFRAGGTTRHFRVNRSTDKLQAFADDSGAVGAEVAAVTDLSAYTVEVAVATE